MRKTKPTSMSATTTKKMAEISSLKDARLEELTTMIGKMKDKIRDELDICEPGGGGGGEKKKEDCSKGKSVITFQCLSMFLDKTTGDVLAHGRGEAGESVGVTIKGYKHFFYLSRQTPFTDEGDDGLKDCAWTLAVIERGLRKVMQGSSLYDPTDKEEGVDHFSYPSGQYVSKMNPSRKRFVNKKEFQADEPNFFHSWSLVKNYKKTMFGKTPDGYTEDVLAVYVEKPLLASLISAYLESDHFMAYYRWAGGFTEDDVQKRKMLRTFEANIPAELVFRTKYSLTQACWWTLRRKKTIEPDGKVCPLIGDGVREHKMYPKKAIFCDRYFECDSPTNVECNDKRSDNATMVLFGWDIESPGRRMGKTNKTRFPIPEWNAFQYVQYCKDFLGLRPPGPGYMPESLIQKAKVGHRYRGRYSSGGDDAFHSSSSTSYSCEEDDTMEESVTDDDEMSEEEGEQDGDEEEEEEGDEKEEEDGDDGEPGMEEDQGEAAQKERRRWTKHARDWVSEDWRVWIGWALAKMPRPVVVEMAKACGYDNWQSLIPSQKDTDPVIIISCCVRRLNVDEDLNFMEVVSFVYVHPSAKPLPVSRPEEKDGNKTNGGGGGGDEDDESVSVWHFKKAEIRVFRSEGQMINAFINYRREKSPDFEYTWNGKVYFDTPYLWDRLHYLQAHGTQTDKKYAFDTNFGLCTSPTYTSTYSERVTNSNQGGDKPERVVTAPLTCHNDGYLVVTNSSYGDKYPSNTLDWVSMKTLVYSRESTGKAVSRMMKLGLLEEDLVRYWYEEKKQKEDDYLQPLTVADALRQPVAAAAEEKKDEDEDKKKKKKKELTAEEMALEVFNDFPQRKMQFDIHEGATRWLEGGQRLKDFIDYCVVDAILPVLHGGKLPLQLAIAKTANVNPDDVFHRGVQMKVLAIIYAICKNDHSGRFMVPDWGNLHLHWPGVFHDEETGWMKSVSEDPDIYYLTYEAACEKWRAEMSEFKEKKNNAWEEAIEQVKQEVEMTESADTASVLPPPPTRKATPSVRGNQRQKEPKKTKTTVAPVLDVEKRTKTIFNRKMTAVKKEFAKRKKKTKAKRITGAFVFDPSERGFIKNKVPTLDFKQLYPSIMLSYALCFSTFITSKTLKYFERWEFTIYPMGVDGKIQCGELSVGDQRLAEEFGFGYSQGARLRVSRFYNESDPLKTVMGTLVKKLTGLRSAAKRTMQQCKDAASAIAECIKNDPSSFEQLYETLAPLNEGKYLRMLKDEGKPIKVVLRIAQIDDEAFNNLQDGDKRLSNSSYGFTSTDPKKGKLPLLELGNTVTTMGKYQLGLAKSVSQKITAKTHRKLYNVKKEILSRKKGDVGHVSLRGEYCAADLDAIARVSRFSVPKFRKKLFRKDAATTTTTTTTTKGDHVGRRAPSLDCSFSFKFLPKGWVYDNLSILCSKYKSDVFYGDSVTGDTTVVLKIGGLRSPIVTKRVDEIGSESWRSHPSRTGKEIYKPKDMYIWQDEGFTKVKKVIRHRCNKPIIRVLTHTGVVDCTKDHSLLNPEGEKIKPTEVAIGDSLLHAEGEYPSLYKSKVTSPGSDITPKEAFSWGAFLADGSCGRYDCPSGVKYSWAVNKQDLGHLSKVANGLPFKTKVIDTLASSGVYKLVPSGESTKDIVSRYRTLFYNDAREKKVPDIILNADTDIMRAFMDGFYAGDGSKAEQKTQKNYRFDQKGKEVCTGLWILAQHLGYTISLNDRATKPDVFRLTCSIGAKPRKNPTAIKKMYALTHLDSKKEEEDFYVYDFETENHHFHVGPGNLVVHNTDSVMLALDEAIFGEGHPERVKEGFEAGRYCAAMINSFEWQIIEIILEKLSLGTELEKKKCYKMRLVHEKDGTFKEFLEKGGTVKRDILPFVQKCIEAHSDVLHKIGEGQNLEDVREHIVQDIKERMMKLYRGEIDIKDLSCKKRVSRLSYKSKNTMPPHAVVAGRMRQRGETVVFGDYITYAMTSINLSPSETKTFHRTQGYKGTQGKTLRNVRRKTGVKSNPVYYYKREDGTDDLDDPIFDNAGETEENDDHNNDNNDDDDDDDDGTGYRLMLPKRKIGNKEIKARDIAETLDYIRENNVPLDILYIYQHQIRNALLMHFSHLLFPMDDLPFVDPHFDSPEEGVRIKARREKILKEQREQTRRLLFWDFERSVRQMWIALYENAYDTFHPIPPSLLRYVERTRHARCSFCAKLEKIPLRGPPTATTTTTATFAKTEPIKKSTVAGTTKSPPRKTLRPHVTLTNNAIAVETCNVVLPKFVCKECSERSVENMKTLDDSERFLTFRKRALDTLCRGCACLLDKPSLDTDKCKSSYCIVYQRKADTGHELKTTLERKTLLNAVLETKGGASAVEW